MNIMITGGLGYIGSHTVIRSAQKGNKIFIIDNLKNSNISNLTKIKRLTKKNVFFYNLDILNYKKIKKILIKKKIDIVFHFAALADLNQAMSKPHDTVNYNILGTVNLLELCKKYKVKRFVFASSIYVNSKQGGFYRSSKRAAEDYVEEYNQRYNLNFTILRFGSLYGERSDKNNGVRKIIESGIGSNFELSEELSSTLNERIKSLMYITSSGLEGL